MLVRIPGILSGTALSQAQELLRQAPWSDGNATSGYQSARAKVNEQIPEEHPVARELGGQIVAALNQNPLFITAALPQQIFPPLFNRYAAGGRFGTHVDNAIRSHRATGLRIRTDLSATLFLAEPQDYDGGELVIEDTYGQHSVKLPAGDLVLYPSTSLHRVLPVTRGARVASFFWIQSLIREDAQRALLFDLDRAIQNVERDLPGHASTVQLTGVYHNLLRRWADV